MTTKKPTTQNPLIGKYFHSLNAKGMVEWQGVVIGSPEPGWYLLQLFEWLMGEPNVMRLVKFDQMHNWLFYENDDQMIFSYEHGAAREGGPYRKYDRADSPKSNDHFNPDKTLTADDIISGKN